MKLTFRPTYAQLLLWFLSKEYLEVFLLFYRNEEWVEEKGKV